MYFSVILSTYARVRHFWYSSDFLIRCKSSSITPLFNPEYPFQLGSPKILSWWVCFHFQRIWWYTGVNSGANANRVLGPNLQENEIVEKSKRRRIFSYNSTLTLKNTDEVPLYSFRTWGQRPIKSRDSGIWERFRANPKTCKTGNHCNKFPELNWNVIA